MEHLVFVIWMIGYPISMAISNYSCFIRRGGEVLSEGDRGLSALIELCIWGFIGYILF